jgi:hypothetical protein
MKSTAFAILLVAAGLPLAGCAAQVGAGGMISVPKDAPATCSGYCSDMGLSLAAVVVMASNVGCVCEPRGKAASEEHGASAAAGGMAAIIVQEESRRQQQASHS